MTPGGLISMTAIAMVFAIAVCGSAEATDLGGKVSAVAKPVTAALGGLTGGGIGGGVPGSGGGGLPGLPGGPSPGGGDLSDRSDEFFVSADGGVGYNVMFTKKLLSW